MTAIRHRRRSETGNAGVTATTDRAVGTRAGTTWVTMGVGLVLLIVLLVFILQNLQSVRVSFFTVHWHLPLAVSLLLATVLGSLIVLTAGSVRIVQLRRHLHRHLAEHHGPERRDAPPPPA